MIKFSLVCLFLGNLDFFFLGLKFDMWWLNLIEILFWSSFKILGQLYCYGVISIAFKFNAMSVLLVVNVAGIEILSFSIEISFDKFCIFTLLCVLVLNNWVWALPFACYSDLCDFIAHLVWWIGCQEKMEGCMCICHYGAWIYEWRVLNCWSAYVLKLMWHLESMDGHMNHQVLQVLEFC